MQDKKEIGKIRTHYSRISSCAASLRHHSRAARCLTSTCSASLSWIVSAYPCFSPSRPSHHAPTYRPALSHPRQYSRRYCAGRNVRPPDFHCWSRGTRAWDCSPDQRAHPGGLTEPCAPCCGRGCSPIPHCPHSTPSRGVMSAGRRGM